MVTEATKYRFWALLFQKNVLYVEIYVIAYDSE